MKLLHFFIGIGFVLFVTAQEKTYAPTLASPANGATNIHPSVLLDWNPVAAAMKYELWIDTSSTFISPLKFSTTNTALTVTNLLFNTTYFWKVRAISINNDTSAWSTTWSLSTLSKPTLKYPSLGSKPPHIVTNLSWNAISGATGYIYQIDTSLSFSSPLLIEGTSTSPSAVVHLLRYGQSYSWRVKAYHSLDTSDWANAFSFKTRDSVPILIPVNGSNSVTPINACKVKSILGTKKYEFWVDNSNTFPNPFIFYWDSTKIKISSGDTVAEYVLDTIPFDSKYMKFRCISKFDTSKWSNVISFNTVNKVVLKSPADGSTNVACNTSLSWKTLPGCVKYILEFDTLSTFSTSTTITISDTNYTGPASGYLKKLKTYYWRVWGITLNDTTPQFNVWSFTTGFGVGFDENKQISFSLYPNPTSDFINLAHSGDQIIEIMIRDVLGNVVQTFSPQENNNIQKINLSSLTRGIYFLEIRGQKGIYQLKFTKQ
ncbi:MAG: T9SS type A sorting domain-containing protein [Bacteroidales bacterium]|nr:T9SS type A sorting domain-containing protein [Bacteroidales bacterium]